MYRNRWHYLVCVFGLLVIAACAPKATPASTASTPPTVAPVTPVPTPTSSQAITQEDAAWAKIVEAAKKEGKVNAYSYAWVGDIGQTVSQAFKEKYGITVNIITGTGAQFTEKIKTEKRMGNMVADMTEGNTLLINIMKLDGLLVSVVNDLPALREKGIWRVEPTAIDTRDKSNLAWRVAEYAPYINTKLVKPEDVPNSWKDLLDPKWKGKMSFTEPNLSSGPYQYMVVLMDNKVWDEEYIKALYRQNLSFPTGIPQELLALARGEAILQIRGSDTTAGRFALEGAPIQAIDMKEGVVLSTASVAAIAGGPNPNAARVFLNWIYGQEGMSIAGKAQGNKMVRKDVPDFRPKAVQINMTRPLVESIENLEKSTQLFREKWFDKVVGR